MASTSGSNASPADAREGIDRQVAIALRYSLRVDSAPRVVATGHGRLAEQILQTAQKAGIPMHKDADLAAVLSRIPLQQEIPPRLYAVVAEVLAWVYESNQRFRKELEQIR